MLVTRIQEIIGKMLSSIYLRMTFIVFISYIPIYICDTNNDIYNFNKEYEDDNIWAHNEDNGKNEVRTILWNMFLKVTIYGTYFVVCCLCLYYFYRCCHEHILYYLNNLYNRLFRRNRANELAHYRDYNRERIIRWIEETSV